MRGVPFKDPRVKRRKWQVVERFIIIWFLLSYNENKKRYFRSFSDRSRLCAAVEWFQFSTAPSQGEDMLWSHACFWPHSRVGAKTKFSTHHIIQHFYVEVKRRISRTSFLRTPTTPTMEHWTFPVMLNNQIFWVPLQHFFVFKNSYLTFCAINLPTLKSHME